MSAGSAIDVVLTALTSLWTAAAPVGVTVFDGEPVDPPRMFLCVGWDESEQPSVTVNRAVGDIRGAREKETLEVSCLLSCWAGNQTSQQLRSDTLGVFNALDSALTGNRQLRIAGGPPHGAAMTCRVTQYEYALDRRGAEGKIAQLRFTVAVQTMQ